MNTVEQGRTFSFEYALSGANTDGFTVQYDVLQYPGTAPAITGVMTFDDNTLTFTATLTPAETAGLAVGQWFIHIKSTDTDEDIAELIKLYVKKQWVA